MMAEDQSIRQYVDLYDQHRQQVEAGAPAVMNTARRRAYAALADMRMPSRGDDGYAVTDLRAMFATDYGVNITRLPFRADLAGAFRCGVPNVSTLTAVTANDVFGPTDSLLRLIPDGVTVCTLRQAAERMPQVLERFYGQLAPGDNAPVALNTLLAQDGVLVHLAPNVVCERALQLVNILGGVNSPLLAMRRILIVVENGASARILMCDHTTAGTDVKIASDTVVEVNLAPGAKLELYDVQESCPNTDRYESISVRQAENSSLLLNLTTLRCGTTRNDICVTLDGPGAECRLYGMAAAGDGQRPDNNTLVVHNAPHCHSDQLFKYVAEGSTQCSFEGLIKVNYGAHHTEAYQSNRNILCGDNARMHTRPHLEIYCDEVKCSHGSATGQLDADALFYMRTRGVPESEARTMLMQAFMADVVDSIALLPLRDRIRHLMEMRLAGGNTPTDCTDCAGPLALS